MISAETSDVAISKSEKMEIKQALTEIYLQNLKIVNIIERSEEKAMLHASIGSGCFDYTNNLKVLARELESKRKELTQNLNAIQVYRNV